MKKIKDTFVLDDQCKCYIPLWWHGQKDVLPDSSPTHCDLTPNGAYFKENGYYFDGSNDYMIDGDSRKVLYEGTLGEWSSILLTEGEVPKEGSIQGTGTKLYLNISGAAPKVTGKIVLYPRYCTFLTYLSCYSNSISTLDVSALTSLTYLSCYSNSISTLDVSALTSLTYLSCYSNSISTLDVSALTSLTYLSCYSNSISTLDVSALTSLTYLSCSNNSISTLDVSALISLIRLYCHGNSISTLDVSALTFLTALICSSNSISTLDVSALTSLTQLSCYNNSMNQSTVDTVLCDMDGHGTSGGTLNISGNAAPVNVTCKNNLIARGWTITTD